MIYRLRVKFVGINMTIVVLMMSVVFGLVYHYKSRSGRKEHPHDGKDCKPTLSD